MEVMKYDGKTKLLPFEYALRVLSSFKNKEVEQVMIDFLVNHHRGDAGWDVADSYWD